MIKLYYFSDLLTNQLPKFCRYYTIRERPTLGSRSINIMEDIPMNESADGALLGLPECQTELDVRYY